MLRHQCKYLRDIFNPFATSDEYMSHSTVYNDKLEAKGLINLASGEKPLGNPANGPVYTPASV